MNKTNKHHNKESMGRKINTDHPGICYKINQFIIRSSKSVLVLNFIDQLKIRSLNIKLGQLCKQVKDNMCNSFLDF